MHDAAGVDDQGEIGYGDVMGTAIRPTCQLEHLASHCRRRGGGIGVLVRGDRDGVARRT